jgi:hypothetical protein
MNDFLASLFQDWTLNRGDEDLSENGHREQGFLCYWYLFRLRERTFLLTKK